MAETETLAAELIGAIEHGDEQTVNRLLVTQPGVEVRRAINQPNTQPLVQTCSKGHRNILKALLDAGGEVNTRCTVGKTCLMHATINDHADCIKVLLDNGADVNIIDLYGQTAATYATNSDSPTCLDLLLKHGSSVNHQDQYGISLLTEAITKEKLQHAQIIIQHGADIDLQDLTGMSALHWAASLGKRKSVKFLCNKGANINQRSNDGKTPLIEAIGEDRYACIKTLLKLGCDKTMCTFNGWAPIIYAAKQHYRCLKLLLCQNEPLDVNGESALAHAIRAYRTQNVRSLLRAGAAVKTVNTVGLCSQHWGYQDENGYAHLSIAAGVQYSLFENLVGYSTHILPYYCDQPDPKVPCALEKLCRHALRTFLLETNPKGNLYLIVKYLPLPEPVKEFLLFNVGIDDYPCESAEHDDSAKSTHDAEISGSDESNNEET